MSKNNRPKRKDRKDFSELEKELKNTSVDQTLEKILQDPEVRFVLDLRDNRIHEKYCKALLRIPSHKLVPSTKYRDDLWQCDFCAQDAYVRAGAKDPYNINSYKEFFRTVRMSPGQVRFLYITLGAITEMVEGELIIHRGEDTWKMVPVPDSDRLTLYHNSYKVRGGKRIFTGKYHVQNEKMEQTYVKFALNTIRDYSWDEHQEEKDSATKPAGEGSRADKTGFVQRILAFFGNGSSKPYAGSDSGKAGAKSNPKSDTGKSSLKSDSASGSGDPNKRERGSGYRVVAEGFTFTGGKKFPDDGTWCLYIWKNFDGEESWDIGAYSKEKGCFAVTDGGHNKRITPRNRVIAWKRINEIKLVRFGNSR